MIETQPLSLISLRDKSGKLDSDIPTSDNVKEVSASASLLLEGY
jgi:hypothetical protein